MTSRGLPSHNGRNFITQLPYSSNGNMHVYDNFNVESDLIVNGNADFNYVTNFNNTNNFNGNTIFNGDVSFSSSISLTDMNLSGNFYVGGNIVQLDVDKVITDDYILTLGKSNDNVSSHTGIEMGYTTGNAFIGYNPSDNLFKIYSDINETIPSDAIFSGATKGTLDANIIGNITGILTGDLIGDINGNVTGNLTGDVNGNITGILTGDVYGDLYGDVIGNIIGNMNGDVTGDLTGDVTGNLIGDVNGDVSGNITGNVYGDLYGDVNGNVFGNLTGDVTGNLYGSIIGVLSGGVEGNVIGDVTGNVTGNVTGDVSGNITGDITGDVTGNLVGNVTGDVTGNLYLTGSNSQITFEDDDGDTYYLINADSTIRLTSESNGHIFVFHDDDTSYYFVPQIRFRNGIDLYNNDIIDCNEITATIGTFDNITGDVTGNLTGIVTGDVTGNLVGNVLGDISGNLVGDVTGNVTGNLTGDVTGNLTGDVMGDVMGDVTGNLVGNVTGNITGNITGDVTGDVTGNLVGYVIGDISGDVSGNITGDITGNVTGNITGDVTGDVTGNLVGYVIGDISGDVTGNITGDITGDITGNVTGNITGDVTGDVTGNLVGDVTGNITSDRIISSGTLTVEGPKITLLSNDETEYIEFSSISNYWNRIISYSNENNKNLRIGTKSTGTVYNNSIEFEIEENDKFIIANNTSTFYTDVDVDGSINVTEDITVTGNITITGNLNGNVSSTYIATDYLEINEISNTVNENINGLFYYNDDTNTGGYPEDKLVIKAQNHFCIYDKTGDVTDYPPFSLQLNGGTPAYANMTLGWNGGNADFLIHGNATSGDIRTIGNSGNIRTDYGNIFADTGDIYATDGNIYTTNGYLIGNLVTEDIIGNISISEELYVTGNITTDNYTVKVGGNMINNNYNRGLEMGYASGNAFFGYDPFLSTFKVYKDIGARNSGFIDTNNTTKGNLSADILGNVYGDVTGNLTGDLLSIGNMSASSDTINLQGGITFYRKNDNTEYIQILSDDTEDKILCSSNQARAFKIMTDSSNGIHIGVNDGDTKLNISSTFVRIEDVDLDMNDNSIINCPSVTSFTGMHNINENYNKYGLILESTGEVDTTNNLNTIVGTRLCKINKSKTVYGISYKNYAVALGEATMYVTNYNGNINNGDYICSSVIEGHGMLQDDDILHSYTVAKATQKINWNNITTTIQYNGKIYKRTLIAVTLHCG